MTILADLLVPFCDASSLNIKDASRAVKKRFVVSISFVDNTILHQSLFKDQYLDWDAVHEYLQNIAYTIPDWIQMLRILDFVQEIHPSTEAAEVIATTLAGVKASATQTNRLNPIESLRLCFAKVKISPSWDLLCKTFIACSLVDIDQCQILLALLEEYTNHGMVEARELVRFMASCKHTKDEYTGSFAAIMDDNRCQVRSHLVIQSLKKRNDLREGRKHDAILSGSAFRKPSLTQILESKSLKEGAKHPQDSFASFCRSSKIASNVNIRIKQTAYFLLCLPETSKSADRISELEKIVGGDMILLANIQSMTILSPDIQELRKIIMETQYTTTPTETMRKFKEKCVNNCLVMTKGLSHWTTIARLYMAAYSRQEIRKDLWCYVLSSSTQLDTLTTASSESPSFLHSSSETESIVQGFVKSNPIVLHELVDVMLMDVLN